MHSFLNPVFRTGFIVQMSRIDPQEEVHWTERAIGINDIRAFAGKAQEFTQNYVDVLRNNLHRSGIVNTIGPAVEDRPNTYFNSAANYQIAFPELPFTTPDGHHGFARLTLTCPTFESPTRIWTRLVLTDAEFNDGALVTTLPELKNRVDFWAEATALEAAELFDQHMQETTRWKGELAERPFVELAAADVPQEQYPALNDLTRAISRNEMPEVHPSDTDPFEGSPQRDIANQLLAFARAMQPRNVPLFGILKREAMARGYRGAFFAGYRERHVPLITGLCGDIYPEKDDGGFPTRGIEVRTMDGKLARPHYSFGASVTAEHAAHYMKKTMPSP